MNIGGFLLLMALFGAMYTFPALTTAIAGDLGTSRAVLQGAFALWGVVIAACGPLSGRLVDRRGVRPALIGGSVALALALIGLGASQAPWQIYAALLCFGAPAHALLQIGAMVAASRSGDRRGGALGMAGAGIGAGLAILFPAAVWVSTLIGWRATFFALAGISIAVSVPAILLAANDPPPERARERAGSWHLLGSWTFLLLFVGGAGIGVADEALYEHLAPYLTTLGLPLASAGTILSLLSFGYIGGQVAGGRASDRLGRWPVGVVAAGLLAGALLALFAARPAGAALIVCAIGAGLGLGATLAVRNATLADVFDGPSLGLVTGAYQWAYALGGGGVGWAGAYVYERLSSYAPVFAASAAAVIVWVVCLRATLSRRGRPHERAPEGSPSLRAEF